MHTWFKQYVIIFGRDAGKSWQSRSACACLVGSHVFGWSCKTYNNNERSLYPCSCSVRPFWVNGIHGASLHTSLPSLLHCHCVTDKQQSLFAYDDGFSLFTFGMWWFFVENFFFTLLHAHLHTEVKNERKIAGFEKQGNHLFDVASFSHCLYSKYVHKFQIHFYRVMYARRDVCMVMV